MNNFDYPDLDRTMQLERIFVVHSFFSICTNSEMTATRQLLPLPLPLHQTTKICEKPISKMASMRQLNISRSSAIFICKTCVNKQHFITCNDNDAANSWTETFVSETGSVVFGIFIKKKKSIETCAVNNRPEKGKHNTRASLLLHRQHFLFDYNRVVVCFPLLLFFFFFFQK